MADSLKDTQKQLKDLIREFERLSKKPMSKVFDDSNITKTREAIELMEAAIDRARENAQRMSQGFVGIREEMEGVLSALGSSDSAIKQATRSLSRSKSITEKLERDQLGISRLNLKELKTLQRKQREETAILKLKAAALTSAEKQTDEGKELLALVEKENTVLTKSANAIKARVDREREITKTIGLTGAAFKGISGTLSKIGIESEALEEIQENIYNTAEATGNSFSVLKTTVRGVGGALKDSLSDPLIQIAIFTKVFSSLINIGASVSEKTAEIARSMGVNSDQAKDFYNNIKASALASSETAATVKSMLEANQQLNESLGTSVVFNQQQLATQTALTQRAGLQAEEAAKIAEFSLLTGQSQEDIYDSVGAINKGVLSNRKVLAETLNVNGQLAAQYRNQPTAIAQAVTQAQKLGMTLEQTQNVSRGLLDFESSISSELEAELLTGRDLNFERARSLALQGKSAEAAAEIRKQVGSLADFQRLNVIQQESIAKAAGMTADELANSLVKEQQLNTLAKSKGISYSEQVELDKQRLDAMSSINNSVSNIKTTFQSIVAGPLASMLEGVAGVFNKIESNPIMRGIIKFLGAGVSIAGAIGSVMLLGRTLVNSFKGRPSGRSGDEVNVRDVSGGGAGGALDTMGKSTFGKGAFGRIGSKKGRAVLSRAVRMGKGGVLAKAALGTSNVLSKGKGLIGGVASKVGGKGIAKTAGKFAGKGLLKRIPVLGSLMGVGYAIDRAIKGDGVGALMELGSSGLGLVDLVAPGVGTALSLAADAGIAARDLKKAGTLTPTATPMATGGIVTQPTRALVGEAGAEAVIPLNEFYKKFDELISVVKSGGNVYLDGNKVGTVLSMVPVKA